MADQRRGEFPVPSDANVRGCRSCGARIIWTTTANKRPIPLSVATIRVDLEGKRFALSHFADCASALGTTRTADAKSHRKPSRATNITLLPMTIDLRDYPATMQRMGLTAISSSIDEAGKVTVKARAA